MRIGLVGGGSGGHFYPLMAVVESLREKYPAADLHLYYFGPNPYDAEQLKKHNIQFVKISSGKQRLYSSVENYFDIFKVLWGIFVALLKLPIFYPDVIFSKGSYTAYPVLMAAWILRIPVVQHDSDTVPGRVSIKFAKYARLIACSWTEGANYFLNTMKIPEDRIDVTGLPLRRSLNPIFKSERTPNTPKHFSFINKSLPLITVMGGSQGSQNINEAVMAALPQILPFAQVIHQTGKYNFEIVKKTTDAMFKEEDLLEQKVGNKNEFDLPELKKNYFIKDFFNESEMREIYENSSIIVTRAGSSQIMEAFAFGIPTVLIPIREEVSRDQTKNAFAAMRRGAGIVIEEKNLTPHILQNEIIKMLQDTAALARMSASARESATFDAAPKIAHILLRFCKSHL
jgi:UDP-N-acetylglucosamine--N-acetylmuramyl-(pentapeptide) pyrophosphoryl-undecaprenol N-acetylglucosamine transferase